ncbi:DinB/UmuC family translesion DNA polymerase [Limosilactobacillus caecicola]|uniref:DinB/UmuC family translesion DNA polymerase n=1 Tax=Limosilactobacillus caecicola TaxID=2941332 RepID=UPI0023AB2DD6|nr:hypothetical protein [Limosilactobacillus caecicola]
MGNSQVLAKDYVQQAEIELVIKEIGAQVAARLRAGRESTLQLILQWGVIDDAGLTGFAHSSKLDVSTAETNLINRELIWLFLIRTLCRITPPGSSQQKRQRLMTSPISQYLLECVR